MSIENILERLRNNESESIERLLEWLRIPSVSTDPEKSGDVRRAAEWTANQLREAGFQVEVCPTGDADSGKAGHPVVFGHSSGDESYTGPHVLFYGHYDVQPADPLELWEGDPFEPIVKPGGGGDMGRRRIVARGACDDKGQVMMFLQAARAWKEITGKPLGGAKFTIMIEGEEEIGSANLEAFIEDNKTNLEACDFCLISDTGMLSRDRPAITYGIRGLAYTEVILHGPDQDLHSGLWGGKVPNPLNELTRVLGQLWDEKRRVTIDGFYDSVREITDDERRGWEKLGIDSGKALAGIGLPPEADVGEEGYNAVEREWARPTAEINGIVGGYTGPGAKTVIPASASAKVSFRLVADQDPKEIPKMFFDWLEDRRPPGCRWEFIDHSGGWPATVPTDSKHLQAAVRAVAAATGKRPELIRCGGSIPVAGSLKAILGIDTIFMGFGLADDRVHSPNEKFELDCMSQGARSHALFIEELLAGRAN